MREYKRDRFGVSEEDFDVESFNIVSANDCTGVTPTLPRTDAEKESYRDIYKREAERLTGQKGKGTKNSESGNKIRKN